MLSCPTGGDIYAFKNAGNTLTHAAWNSKLKRGPNLRRWQNSPALVSTPSEENPWFADCFVVALHLASDHKRGPRD